MCLPTPEVPEPPVDENNPPPLWSSPGDTFSFSDVTRNILLYRHAGLSAEDDSMTFSVSDGISMATTVVQVQVLRDGGLGPQRDATASMILEVGEKSSTVIRRSQLSYSVSDRPEERAKPMNVWDVRAKQRQDQPDGSV